MSEKLIKPYEISVWEDSLEPNGQYYIETKLFTIGSDTMEGYNKVYEPVFIKKTNGEKTLTFSLKYQYFDPYIGTTVINPFSSYLINERKIKLHYDGQWYDFIIKDHSESSDGLTWTYIAVDAFVNELSKNGYNKEFDVELGNNQGTAIELAKAVVEDTDWVVDEENSSVGSQEISEAVYDATLLSRNGITIVNAETGEPVGTDVVQAGASIYLFYNYVANQDGNFIQFILQESNPNNYELDDNNTIKATNYRITTPLTFDEAGQVFKKDTTEIISFRFLDTSYQAYRKIYGHLSTYDPVMGRTVKRYQLDGLESEIYNYTDYMYSTSDVVVNYVTNGDTFNIYDNGTLQGWDKKVESTGTYATTNLVTYPAIEPTSTLKSLASYTQIEGYMEVKFPNNFDNYKNGIFNSGIEDSAGILKSISAGQEFVFRWRGAKSSTKHGPLSAMSTDNLRVVVAKYNKSDSVANNYFYNKLDSNNIILDFNTTAQVLNNYISGGVFNSDYTAYLIDGVAQEPSTKYIYEANYVWDSSQLKYVSKTDLPTFFDYYYMTATAQRSITEAELSEPNTNIGIFIYTKTNPENYYYFQDIQLTRLYRDGNDQILTIGNMPTATATSIEYFYVQPKTGTAAENVEIFTKLEALASSLNTSSSNIKPIYNENATKYLSISESHSNCYNLLQTIAETFECWVDLVVEHDDNGAIVLDSDNKPVKKVILREYIGKDNFAGFKYGININSIERTVNSDEIVTKLYVIPAQSDYTNEGSVAISYASMNPSREEYILDFSYYYNQGLIANKTDTINDINAFNETLKTINRELSAQEQKRRNLEAALTSLNSQRNIYTNLIDEAKNNVNNGKEEFLQLTGNTYDGYRDSKTEVVDLYYFLSKDTEIYKYKDYYNRNEHTYTLVTNPEGSPLEHGYYEYVADLESNNTILDIIAKIYTNSYVINNYIGILTNIEKEYKKIRKELRGSEEFTVTIGMVSVDSNNYKIKVAVSDYISAFEFNVAGQSYETDINTKTFEIGSTNISNITIKKIPYGYTLWNSNNQQINIENTITLSTDRIIVLTLKPNEVFDGVEDVIEKIQVQKDKALEIFNNKYNRFIQEGTWSSTDYINSNLYYLDALQVSKTSAQPQITYSINVVEVSELEGLENYKFDAGDKTYIEDTEFFGWKDIDGVKTPVKEEVIVSEVEWHLEEPENNIITVQNYKTRFEDLFQRISATVQTVQYNEATYAKTSALIDAYGMLSQAVLLDSLNNISGQPYTLTSDGSIRIDGDRITIRDLKSLGNIMTLESTGLRISSDGGKTWSTAISGRGINIDTVFTGKINTDKIIIGSETNPSFRWDRSGISAYKRNRESGVYDLTTYVRFDQYGLYGIARDKNFVANSLDDVKDKASFAVTWDGFFIRNTYTDGRVEISSTDDFRVIQTISGRDHERIKIGALEFNSSGQPTKYGIRIKDDNDIETFVTGSDGNITITGTINALGGDFTGLVKVGDGDPYIEIDGENALIKTSNYSDGASYGWMINKDGDAVFNNITARGAIKTAVFEYAEIQAVGGIFIFRPSSTIKSARLGDSSNGEDENDLIVKVDNPLIFIRTIYALSEDTSVDDTKVYWRKAETGYELVTEPSGNPHENEYYEITIDPLNNWCKISNYTSNGATPQPIELPTSSILMNNGLTHVYRISNFSNQELTLSGGKAFVDRMRGTTEEILAGLEGGALIDMGRKDGSANYGIGVNSSDNTVDLPRRAITLFETQIDETRNPKVTYKYKGILGTLPNLSSEYASQNTYKYLAGTQGIYTNNMYIGDSNQFISFFTDTSDIDSVTQLPKRKLKIVADEILYAKDDGSYGDVKEIEIEQGAQGPAGLSALQISILSTFGTSIRDSASGAGALYAAISKDGVEIDSIGNNVQAVTSTSEITSPTSGQYCIVINSTNQTATAYMYNGTSWVVAPSSNVTYAWYFRNKDNQPVTIPGVRVDNKCLYVSSEMVDKKLTAEVKITVES